VLATDDEELPMCVRCDRPNLTTEAYEEQVLQLVEQNRFAVQGVGGSR